MRVFKRNPVAILIGLFVFLIMLASVSNGDENDFKKIRSLAEQGDADAQHDLGKMYLLGSKDLPENYGEALKWYLKAAEQGHADAQTFLGLMYLRAEGVPQDYKEAFRWFTKAAEQGQEEAQLELGIMYHEGEGVPQDYVMAHVWYNISAANGGKEAAGMRDAVAKLMTPEQITKAQRLAKEWMEKHRKDWFFTMQYRREK